MDRQRTIQFRLGIVVVAFVIVTIILVVMFGPKRLSFLSGDYNMHILFTHAPMVEPNTPIKKNGVEIGRVVSTELVDNDSLVKVTAAIRRNVNIYSDEECRINSNLLGQSEISFRKKPVPAGVIPAPPTILERGSTMTGFGPTNPLEFVGSLESQISGVLRSFTTATEEVTKSFNGINLMLGTPEEIARKQQRLEMIVDKTVETMSKFDSLATGVSQLINDPDVQESVRITARNAPKLINDVQLLMNNVNEMIADVKIVVSNLDRTFEKVDDNLTNMTKFTQSLGENGPKFVETFGLITDRLDATMSDLQKFMGALNNPNGSLGKLLDDPEFFNRIQRTAKNIEELSLQVKPILSDARVFSDKIAREPGLLGLRGMLAKNSPIKGSPHTSPGFVGSDSTFPGARPEIRLTNFPKVPVRLWGYQPQYEYTWPQQFSTDQIPVFYGEPTSPEMILPVPQHQPSLQYQPVNNVYSRNAQPSNFQQAPPRPQMAKNPIAPAPSFRKETTSKMELDFEAPKSHRPSSEHEVIPLPAVDSAPSNVALGKNRSSQTLELDFSQSLR